MKAAYQTKVVRVEAIQFDGTPAGANEVFDAFDIPGSRFVPWSDLSRGTLLIPTSEGEREASRLDWVVKDALGGFSVKRPGFFAATYEPVK